jgi:hypothetical protein
MSVVRTGSTVAIDTTTASSSQSITVPSDAEIAVVFGGGYFGNVSIGNPVFTLGGSNCTRAVGGTPGGDFDAAVIEYKVSPATGTQTLAWTFPTIASGSVRIFVVFYKSINISSPIGSTGRVDHNSITITTETVTGLTAPTGSMTFGGSASDRLPVMSGNGQTQIAQSADSPVRATIGEKAESTSLEATNQQFSMLLAVVIHQSLDSKRLTLLGVG